MFLPLHKVDRLEYIRIPLSAFPEHIMKQFNLREKALDGNVYVETRRSFYSLPQAGAQAKKILKVNLASYGYFEIPRTPRLWQHITRAISFSLVVDDYGVKYINRADADHLIASLKNNMKYQNIGQ